MRLCTRLSVRHVADIIEFLPTTFLKAQSYSLTATTIYKAVGNILQIKKNLSVTDWVKLRNTVSSPGFGYQAFIALMARDSGLSEIKKLKAALQETNALSPILKAQMFPAFQVYSSQCTEEDFKHISDTLDEIHSQFPSLTSDLVGVLLKGLIPTPFWKERGELLLSNLGDKVQAKHFMLYATAAFTHNDFNLAWELMDRAAPTALNVFPQLYHLILDKDELRPEENLLLKLLNFLENRSFMLTVGAAQQMSNIFEKKDIVSRFSVVDSSGVCNNCNRKLQKVPLSKEELEILLKNVGERFDLNCKFSTYEQKELDDFKLFLKKCPPYSVVMDGANMFYRFDNLNMLQAVLTDLEKRGHKILLICKNHQKKNKKFISLFKQHIVYHVKDRSKDDSFVIYAALSSGVNTLVVSNDFYGTYYTDIDRTGRIPFRKWQMSNHVVGMGYMGEKLMYPEFSPIFQRSEDGRVLHIPLVSDEGYSGFSPEGWLCVQHVSEEQKRNAEKLWPVREFKLQESGQYNVNAFRGHYKLIKENFRSKKYNQVYSSDQMSSFKVKKHKLKTK